jgi:hypothetical protein
MVRPSEDAVQPVPASQFPHGTGRYGRCTIERGTALG